MKRILYIACGFDGGKSGISVYMLETLRRLAKNNRLTVVTTEADRKFLPTHGNIRYHQLAKWWNRPLWNMLYVWFFLPWSFRRKDFDFLLLPAANRRAPWFKRFFTIAVVHDLSQYHVEAKYDFFRMFYITRLLPLAVRKADRVVAISDSTRKDLRRYWHIPDERLEVIWNGCDLSRYTPRAECGEKERIRKLLGIKGEYLLYLSRIEHPGKNHVRLLEAFSQLAPELQQKYTLVLAGADWSGAAEAKFIPDFNGEGVQAPADPDPCPAGNEIGKSL